MQFNPEALARRKKEVNPYYGPEFELVKQMAMECLLWRMSPEYWESLTPMEHRAWVEAWNEIQDARNGKG